MSSSLAAWLASVLGRRIVAPGALGGQCVDLADSYIATCYGLPPVRRNAIGWSALGALPAGWRWEPNGPTNYPPAGGVVVWGPSPVAGTGANGHIAIALVADALRLISCDQNWSDKQEAGVVVHDYAGVLGWWHPPAAPGG